MAFADHQFLMLRPAGDGYTRRQHLEAAAAVSIDAALQLESPPLPAVAEPIWHWYCELSGSAVSSGMGPAVITHQQIEAWSRLRRIRLTGIELDWLLGLDRRRMEEYNGRDKTPPKRGSP